MKDSPKPKTAVKPPRSPAKQGRPPHGAARAQGRSGASRDGAPSTGSPVTMSAPTASTDLLRSIVEMAPDAIVVIGEEGRILLVNQQAEALFGYTRDELLGQTLELLIPARLRQTHVQHRAHYTAAPRTRPMGLGLEPYGRRTDGSEFPVEIRLADLETMSDQLVIASVRDMTERTRLEQALYAAEQQARAAAEAQRKTLETMVDELPSAVCLVLGTDARLALANRALADVWGATWSVGQPMLDFLASNGIQVLQLNGKPLPLDRMVVFRAVRDGESVRQHQQIVRHPDGTLLPVVVNAIPLNACDLHGLAPPGREPGEGEPDLPEPPMALIVHQDVSALTEAERVKDDFVALAAHELRNPMAALKGFATMLQPDDRSAGRGYAAEVEELQGLQADAVLEIQRATDRLVALTDDLLDVTRLQAGRLELHPE